MPWAAAAVVAGSVISSSSAKAGVKAQEKQNERSEAFIREQAINARNDAIPLYNAGQENRGIGTQAALDVFEETVPEQGRLFTAGNMAAQGTMLSGLEQSNNAILGMPVDYSGLQPQEFTPNYGFLEQGIPECCYRGRACCSNGGSYRRARASQQAARNVAHNIWLVIAVKKCIYIRCGFTRSI